MENKSKNSSQASGGKTEQGINKNQRAPHPGDEKNAAGKNNKNKQENPGDVGSEPLRDDDINKGDQ